MDNLLVGVDGSEAATEALCWTVGLVRALAAKRLIVTTVYVADPTDTSGWDAAHDRARQLLESWCRPARDAGVAYEPMLVDGEAGPALRAAASEHQADLTIVSRRGVGGFDALAAGSTADYLAHHTRLPLAVVPPSGAASPPTRLLIGLDGSADSLSAATWAARLASPLRLPMTAAYVPTLPEILGKLTPSQRTSAEEILATRWTAPLRDAGVDPDCTVLESRHPGDALIDLAREAGADLIVVGTRAIGGLRRIRLGGVTMQLLHHSDVPVIAVPPAA